MTTTTPMAFNRARFEELLLRAGLSNRAVATRVRELALTDNPPPFAEGLGLFTAETVRLILAGTTTQPRRNTVAALAHVLDVDVTELYS